MHIIALFTHIHLEILLMLDKILIVQDFLNVPVRRESSNSTLSKQKIIDILSVN